MKIDPMFVCHVGPSSADRAGSAGAARDIAATVTTVTTDIDGSRPAGATRDIVTTVTTVTTDIDSSRPCADRDIAATVATDIDDHPRVAEAARDIGADERP